MEGIKEETVAQEAYRLLKDIPKSKFLTDIYTDNIDKCCVIGHYTRLKSNNPNNYSTDNCNDSYADNQLREQAIKFGVNIAAVNNRANDIYKQKEPKARVMACLKDMIKKGY